MVPFETSLIKIYQFFLYLSVIFYFLFRNFNVINIEHNIDKQCLCLPPAGFRIQIVLEKIKDILPLPNNWTVTGISTGAILGCFVTLGFTHSDIKLFMENMYSKCKNVKASHLNYILETWLREVLPDDAYIRCNSRLIIGITRFPERKPVLVSQFDDQEHLIVTLCTSCSIPLIQDTWPPRHNDVDGGFTIDCITVGKTPVVISLPTLPWWDLQSLVQPNI